MNQQVRTLIISFISFLLLLNTICFVSADELVNPDEIFVVKGKAMYKETAVENGSTIQLVFSDSTEETTIFPMDNGYNFNLGFIGHNGETGYFQIIIDDHTYVLENQTVSISSSQYKYDVEVTIETQTNQPPQASIDQIRPSPSHEGESVTFNGTGSDVDGTITSYEWKSSIDGIFSTSQNETISELTVGTHEITFRVQDNESMWSNKKTTDFTVENKLPHAKMLVNKNEATTEESLEFSAEESFDSLGNITTYFWDFDDDSNKTGKTTTHQFSSAGTYTVNLTVTDDENTKNWTTKEITIIEYVASHPPSKPEMTADNDNITFATNTTYTFTFTSTDQDEDNIKYVIDWGDGTNTETEYVSSGESITETHEWSEEGLLTVSVYAVDENNQQSSTFEKFISVETMSQATSQESEESGGFPWLLLIVLIIIAGVGGGLFYLYQQGQLNDLLEKVNGILPKKESNKTSAQSSNSVQSNKKQKATTSLVNQFFSKNKTSKQQSSSPTMPTSSALSHSKTDSESSPSEFKRL